ncbi:hypothetical protein U370_05105 [Anaplasma marginale str. Dawn]|nr:hypothetical protein U128_05325 [Anaplasma marginale str. Gypsy Plains]AGZ80141.1 hypothetical protein U370_05105 [Anaplasma marginale str. Dawn]
MCYHVCTGEPVHCRIADIISPTLKSATIVNLALKLQPSAVGLAAEVASAQPGRE